MVFKYVKYILYSKYLYKFNLKYCYIKIYKEYEMSHINSFIITYMYMDDFPDLY